MHRLAAWDQPATVAIDPLIPEDPGLLASVGRYLGRFAQVPLNLLSGDVGGAFRQGADILGETVDAALPGDWIPEFSRPEDEKKPSQMLGIDQSDSILAGGVDFVGETLLNPLTYLTGGASAAAGTAGKAALKLGVPFTKAGVEIPGSAAALETLGSGAKAAYGVVPKSARDAIQGGIVNTKSALGWLKPKTKAYEDILNRADASKTAANMAAMTGVREALQGMSDTEAVDLFRAINNYKRTGEGPGETISELLPGSETVSAPYRLGEDIASRTGPAPQSVDPIYRPEAYKQIKAPGETQPIDDLGREVGVTGVAVPRLEGDVLEAVTKDPFRMADQVFTPQYANDAAARTLDQAYPLIPTDARYASGIDVANQSLIAPGSGLRGVRTYGETAEANRLAGPAPKAPPERVDVDQFTGAVTREPITPENARLIPASTTEAVSAQMGGKAPALEKAVGESAPRLTAPMVKLEDQLAQWNARIDALGKSPEEAARLKEYAAKYLGYIHNDFVQKVKDFGALKQGIGDDVLTMIPQDYAHREFKGMLGSADSIAARKLKDNQSLREYLGTAEGSAAKLDENLISSTVDLASQAGRVAERSEVAKGLLGDKFVSLADEATRGEVSKIIEGMKQTDPEAARLFQTKWDGMEPRGPVMEMLAKTNAVFKPAAVYGLVVPRVGGIMKNILGMSPMIGMEGQGRQAVKQLFIGTPYAAAEAVSRGSKAYRGISPLIDKPMDAFGKVTDAFLEGWSRAFGVKNYGETSKDVDLISEAFKQSGGRAKNARQFLEQQNRPDLVAAFDNGIIDGFVSREAVERSIRESGWGRKLLSAIGIKDKAKQERAFNIIDAPQEAFRGGESFARLSTFKDLLQRNPGMDPKEAAGVIRSGLFDYSVKTGANRTLRDLIPFAAYQTNAIRQSGKFLAKNPAAAVALGNLSDTDPSAQYPWMSGQTNIPIGTAETGETQYLTGLGLPTESLNSIPNLSGSIQETGQELRSNLLGNAHPLVKSAYGVLTGEDPRFGSAYGSYDRLPGNIEGGKFGQVYNQLAGTGLIQPIATPLNQIGQLIDERTGAGDKALSLLTGTRVVNVDEDRALRQRLQEFLSNNPDVEQFQSFYQNSPDPETQALIKALNEVKRRMKAKREAASVTD